MQRLRLFFYYIYSFFFCLRYLPLRVAVKIPILVHPSMRIGKMGRGRIVLPVNIRRGMLCLGLPGTEGRDAYGAYLSIHKGARLVVGDNVIISRGSRIVIEKGEIVLGSHFFCNANCFFNCNERITIGDDCMFGWDIHLNTTDGHDVYENGMRHTLSADISIGNHVWVASYATISKGVTIADGCIVAQRSLLTRRFEERNTLIAGIPAKVIRNNMDWEA